MATCVIGSGQISQRDVGERADFARKLAMVKPGMTKAQVRALLGEPSDVVTYPSPSRYEFYYRLGRETWCYGAMRHLAYPTLGYVIIDGSGQVWRSYGNEGKPPTPGLFQEYELRGILTRIFEATKDSSEILAIIRVTNLLQPLGKDKAISALKEYFRIDPRWGLTDQDTLLCALRVLFNCSKEVGYVQMCPVGPETPAPSNLYDVYPRFPVVMMGDIPLLIRTWERRYVHPNSELPAPKPNAYFAHFAKYGTLRAARLQPTDKPLEEFDRLARSPDWIAVFGREYKVETPHMMRMWYAKTNHEQIQEELLSLLQTVQEPPDYWATAADEAVRLRALQGAEALKVKWSTEKQSYTFPDGKILPPKYASEYIEYRWRPKCLEDVKGELRYERSANYCNSGIDYTLAVGQRLAPALIQYVDVTLDGKIMTEYTIPDNLSKLAQARLVKMVPQPEFVGNGTSYGFGWPFPFPKGHKLQIKVFRNGTMEGSPIYSP